MISKQDLDIFEALEDRADLLAISEAMNESQETVSWDALKNELNDKHGL